MSAHDIPLDTAELLSALLEALLYGFSLLMFGATIWTLLFKRSTRQVNRKMFAVACALLLCSTAHMVIDIIRVIEGLIFYRNSDPGGSIAYFSDVSNWTFVSKNYVFAAQTLIGDGVVLYRCYVVWRSKLIMILPMLLWCALAATGIGSPYTASKVTQNEVFGGSLSRWITAFYASTLSTNLLTTILLASRIWFIDRKATKLHGNRRSQLRQMLHILVDAGAIYSVTLIIALICFLVGSNAQYLVLDVVTPIVSITFYMVIIRVGVATQGNRTKFIPLSSTPVHRSNAERRRIMQVHITTLTESKIEDDRHTYPTSSTSTRGSPSMTKLEDEGEV